MSVTTTTSTTPAISSTTTTARRSLAALCAMVLLAIVPLFVLAAPAGAVDSWCRSASASGYPYTGRYIAAPGMGYTAWRTSVHVRALDRCNHGDVRVSGSFYQANVTAKNALMWVSGVEYRTSTSTAWRPMHQYNQSMYGFSFGTGGHADLSAGTRVAFVRIRTAMWRRAEAGGWVGLTSDTVICSLYNGTCYRP